MPTRSPGIVAATGALVLAAFTTAAANPLPYVDEIRVSNRGGGPICQGDSIYVLVRGTLPNSCVHFVSVEPSPYSDSPAVYVQIRVDCPGTDCREPATRWQGRAVLAPLPAGEHSLTLRVFVNECVPVVTPRSTTVPFRVEAGEGCEQGPTCFHPTWIHPHGFGQCDATIGPGRDASVTFALRPTAPLAGLQGAFSIGPPGGLVITGLEPVGPAAGMRLTWTRTADGARFVMFAKSGAPIPASTEAVPILSVTVAADSATALAPNSYVNALDLLGSDADGNALTPCAVRSVADVARICREDVCDFNADARTDIRDLVLMARCLRNPRACGWDDVADCDGDGDFDLDDVLCCARRVLGLPRCTDCAPDTTRPADGVALRFGAPRRAGDGIDVPLLLVRSEALGGARLEIAYPEDVFTGATLALSGHSGEWLEVNESRPGVARLGMIRLAEVVPITEPGPLPLTLHLTLAPDREPGGELALTGEFSGLDGALLAIPHDAVLPLGARLAISEPQPNPFAAEARFTVALPREGPMKVTIHDVGGRRVATLVDEVRAPGVVALRWDGRTDRGAVAGQGIYFVRVHAAGQMASRKLIRLAAP